MSHEISETIANRESPEKSLKNPNELDFDPVMENKAQSDALFLEVKGLKQNK